ncbi:cell adhesion molecule CEACAM5-like [Fundulus diaphanus]
MESLSVFFLILTTMAFTDSGQSQTIQASMNPVAVGDNVTLSSIPITVGAWTFNGDLLVFIYPGNFMLSKNKTGGMIFNITTSSLTITSARLQHSGLYKIEQMNEFSVQLQLSVQEPISNVTLSAKRTDLVEFNDTAVFMCSVSTGTSLSYKWLAGNSTISSGADVQLSNDGASLTMTKVTRFDMGPYRCNVSNGVGYEVSPSVYLTINYGPSNTSITVMPVKYMYRSGSDISLSCWADSKPTAMIYWMFDEVRLNQSGSQLDLQNVNKNNSGTYKCVAYNPFTMRFSSTSTEIRVMDPVTAAVIHFTSGPAVLNKTFTLQCEVTGPVGIIHWEKDGSLVAPDMRTVFGMDNKTLTLSAVQLSDGGQYQCHAFNLVSNMSSGPFKVQVNYGPMEPTIMGPNVVKSGSNVTLSCNAESVPPSLYRWYFNGEMLSNMSEYMTPSLTKEMSGNYICMALNHITGKNSTASIMLTVVDPIQNVKIEQSNPAIEGNLHTLTCNITGPADHIYWMKDDQPLHSDNRTVFSMDNMTVMFKTLNRSDARHYQCLAINAVGNMSSVSYKLLVNYGPEMPIIMGPSVVKTGDNVTLTCQAESVPVSSYRWFFSGSLVSNMSVYMTPPLREEMSGKYVCEASNSISGKNSSASIMLTVIDPIHSVEIAAPINSAIENYSYNLTCNVAGPADHIYWMKNGELLLADNRTVFYMDNKTVMLSALSHSDAGNYQCMALNAVGNMTSAQYNLIVNFGPETPVVYGPYFGATGHEVVFNCSANSMPPSTYTWWFNNTLVANTSRFIVGPLTFNMSGKYTCMAHNHVTGANSTKATMLTVIGAIESVMIQSNSTPINNENFTLTCAIVGPYDAIYWMKDGMQLNMNASNTNPSPYIMKENMLHFTPLTVQSNGTYECVATNKAIHHKSAKYPLLVIYGPLNVSISGPDSAKNGTPVSLTCSADSQPECDFHWFLNNRSTPLRNGSFINFSATKGQIGNYICVATNPVTNISMNQTKTFSIADHASTIYIPNKGALLLLGLYAFFAPLLSL